MTMTGCSQCRSTNISEVKVTRSSEHQGVHFERHGIIKITCADCGETSHAYPRIAAMLRAEIQELVSREHLSEAELRYIQEMIAEIEPTKSEGPVRVAFQPAEAGIKPIGHWVPLTKSKN